MRGYNQEGKLLERAWKWAFGFKEEVGIFPQKKRTLEMNVRIEYVDLTSFHCQVNIYNGH